MTITVRNKGRQWIQHGDNVITLANPHTTPFGYLSKVTIRLPLLGSSDVINRGNAHINPLTPSVGNQAADRLIVKLHGGFGFTSCGFVPPNAVGTTERFDDVANTQTARTSASARFGPTGYSLNGFGFTSGGATAGPIQVGTTERFDDVINTHTSRTGISARDVLAGYTLNGFGFTNCGRSGAGTSSVVQRFDDTTNFQTVVSGGAPAITSRQTPAGYGLNNLGFTSGGETGGGGVIGAGTVSAVTERYDPTIDIAFGGNQTTRANLTTARRSLTGFSINGLGFTSCGENGVPAIVGTTERLDDDANTQSVRTSGSGRRLLAGYSLNGFGFTSGGDTVGVVATTERFDDIANTWTARTGLNTARNFVTGYSTNEYFVDYITSE